LKQNQSFCFLRSEIETTSLVGTATPLQGVAAAAAPSPRCPWAFYFEYIPDRSLPFSITFTLGRPPISRRGRNENHNLSLALQPPDQPACLTQINKTSSYHRRQAISIYLAYRRGTGTCNKQHAAMEAEEDEPFSSIVGTKYTSPADWRMWSLAFRVVAKENGVWNYVSRKERWPRQPRHPEPADFENFAVAARKGKDKEKGKDKDKKGGGGSSRRASEVRESDLTPAGRLGFEAAVDQYAVDWDAWTRICDAKCRFVEWIFGSVDERYWRLFPEDVGVDRWYEALERYSLRRTESN